VISIFAEVQLFKDWVPLTKVSDLIGEVSYLRKSLYFRYGVMWPFTSREIFMQGCGLVMKDEQACCMALSSVEGESWLGYPAVRDKKTVEIDIKKAFIIMNPIGTNLTKLRIIINLDPHIDYIPQRIMNYAMKNMLGVYLGYIQK